ncbi:putative phage holin [Leucobacter japonicus]|uniref:putative phage holin n=1 Tax=Leucobacter japonicus TaxID=1461259 RepID=UPI000A447731|nr:hypothetical protein [Leucobacter japonicus]
MTRLLGYLGDALIWVSLLGALAFCLSYAMLFDWRRTAPGRAVMHLAGAISLWGAYSVIARAHLDFYLNEWGRIIAYLALAATIWRLVVTLWRSWTGAPAIRAEPETEEQHAVDHP